ncbi:outer membrane protein OmpA-like peptidoglycan-associated protein [Devosia subaequoris]|uniref:Outer membrane protein OmpA-like peptidoglycan-associated protein n=1 Tax=Devosia subaequoris TaxID=395930 RepID=A0A7W6IKB7_9HYPH|nr:OmpA family protein [Devosia subaequoris]MBB4050842.1 outer membrane protein OmpA-like peptidoglycan-associated protein [Devosia subaequoris]MCP1208481.1 OmpA family protein [Devosia subaequoris]
MIRDLLKWVAPGVVTVLGGTIAALAMATPAMVDNLAAKSRAALDASGSNWAHLSISGRQLLLSGTTSSDTERDLALTRLAALTGVGRIDQTVTIAPLAAPYRINLAVEDGAVSLFGSVPNEALRQSLMSMPGLTAVDLQIRSGQPNEQKWRQGVEFALAQAAFVDSGHFELSGLTLNAIGRASSERALGHLQMALAELPDGIGSGEIIVEPVRVTPYIWRAEYDGERIAISGHVPEQMLVDRLRLADVSGVPIATGLSLGSGAPDGFAEQAKLLVEQLALLDRGEARIIDGVSHLTGVPPTIEVAQAVSEALSGPNSIVELQPPRIGDYWISINRQPSNVLVFDGYVPDEATRAQFAEVDGADVSFLKFGAGAPEAYHRAVDFGLELLSHLSEGRFALAGTRVSLSGLAQTPTDYRAIQTLLDEGLPQGLELGDMAFQAPPAASYSFAARRDASGVVTLEGLLPNPQVETELLALAGSNARSNASFASGETPNFVASAEQAMQFLPWLRNGVVRFDGTAWSVEGEPASAIDKSSIEAEFAVRGLAQSGWTLALTNPQPEPVIAVPFVWSAERLPDGSFLFAGNVPATSLQAYLKVHVGTRVADTSRVALGAPDNFAAEARAAVDALLALQEGRAAFDGTNWTLAGEAATADARNASLELASVLNIGDGAAINAPDPVNDAPYLWSASKAPDGSIVFNGAVPAESLQRFLAVRGGDAVTDNTTIRPDAPESFSSEVLQALDLLALLSDGEVAFDGTSWTANGVGLTADVLADADAVLGTAAPRWSIALLEPQISTVEPVEPEVIEATTEEPVTEPEPERTPAEEPVATDTQETLADAPAIDPTYTFSATRTIDGAVSLSGSVPAAATASYAAALTGADASALRVRAGAPDGFVGNLQTGLRALLQLQTGQLALADNAWSLSGEAPSTAVKAEIEVQLAALDGDWSASIAAPTNLALCQARLAELSAHNAILFQSGAAIISASASAELDAFAEALVLCPNAAIDVEGHTDSDGDDQRNLALSVARAEAVVNALIDRGVAPERLYAIGYGEAQPVADNATAAGKRQNRRIVVSVRAVDGAV